MTTTTASAAYALVESTQRAYFEKHRDYIARLDEAQQARSLARASGEITPDLPRAPDLIGIQATVGLGKSRSVTSTAMACAAAGLPMVVLVPTHELADEYLRRFEAAGVAACHYYGRQEPGNPVGEAWTCWKREAVETAGSRNHRPAQSLCRTCPHGLRVVAERGGDGGEKALKWFKEHGKSPDKFEHCRFLFEALPAMLSAPILIMPVQSFSETAGVWQERDQITDAVVRQTQRLVIVDESIELAREIVIRTGDAAGWRDALPRVQEQVEKQIDFLSRQELDEALRKELEQAMALRSLLPELDALFGDCAAAIARDKQPDGPRILSLYDAARKAGGVIAGGARWERISFVNKGEGDFHIPLRALAVLASNIRSGCLRTDTNHWAGYEVSPVVEWALQRGSTVFMDATMPLPMRVIIESSGGTVIEASAPQNHRVTRVNGYLYSRGQVGPGEYQRNAKSRMAEIARIAAQLPKPAAILTHKASLKYSVDHCQHDDAATDARAEFEAETGVDIGWFGGHDRGHNAWAGRHLAIVGMPLLSPKAIASDYGVVRAALMQAGVAWPAWDGQTGGEGAEAQGVPLPSDSQVRAWLLDSYAQGVAQAVGRNRAVNHQGEPLTVQLWGGIDHPELDEALARHGIEIQERVANTLHKTLNEYRNRGTDMISIDQAIEAINQASHHTGICPSIASVRSMIVREGGKAADAAIAARLRTWRDEGKLPAAGKGGKPWKPMRDAEIATISREAWLEAWKERAGILEFDAGLSRGTSEVAAREIVTRELGPCPPKPETAVVKNYRTFDSDSLDGSRDAYRYIYASREGV